MRVERRVGAILVVLACVALPAAVLRVLCVGSACDDKAATASSAPFCSLPQAVRDGIAAGYREGRSPDVLGVTRRDLEVHSEGVDPEDAPWPSLGRPTVNVPVVFAGRGVSTGTLPSTFGLDDIAPTLAEISGFAVPHPEVRSGEPIPAVATGDRPRLIAVIVLRSVSEAVADPTLTKLAMEGTGTMTAKPGSLPLDTSALMTTIGTGGTPSQHGITGTVIKNDSAQASQAWFDPELEADPEIGLTHQAPTSIIATLADDLDEELRQEPRIGLVADTLAGRGLVGGNWYVDNDRDDYRITRTRDVRPEVRRLLVSGYGTDEVVDLIGISHRVGRREGAIEALRLLRMLQRTTGGRAAAVIVALPRLAPVGAVVGAATVDKQVDTIARGLVAADTSGGLFLDQQAVAEAETSKDEVLGALRSTEHAGEPAFADAFPGFAVALSKFC